MKELEKLKQQWAKQNFDQHFSKEDLKGFLQNKSAHSIKWIFYLSIIEFVLYLSFPLFSSQLPRFLCLLQIVEFIEF